MQPTSFPARARPGLRARLLLGLAAAVSPLAMALAPPPLMSTPDLAAPATATPVPGPTPPRRARQGS